MTPSWVAGYCDEIATDDHESRGGRLRAQAAAAAVGSLVGPLGLDRVGQASFTAPSSGGSASDGDPEFRLSCFRSR